MTHTASQLRTTLHFLSQAYNVRYSVDTGTNSSGKRQASYKTVRQPVTDDLLFKHFAGTAAVSVQPLTDDGHTCNWGALDIDSYGIPDLEATVRQRMAAFDIPCYIEPSKSGGVHVYIILDSPVDAKPFRRALRKLAVWIGFPQAEIRPAQDSIKVEEGDLGRFMVLPCFGVSYERAMEILSLSTTTAALVNQMTDEGELSDLPPCLFPLQREGQKSGWTNRNLFMYQLGVAYRYKHPADWQARLTKYNTEVLNPSLDDSELAATVAQLEKNARCHYICSSAPFDAVCNKPACTIRKFGVAARESTGSLISTESICVLDTDPPTWFVSLIHPVTQDSHRVKLSTAQLQQVSQFKKRCMEALKIMPTLPTQKEWEAVVARLMDNVIIEPVPFELTPAAMTFESLFRYLLSAPKATDEHPDKLLEGRVLTSTEGTTVTVTFRLPDFLQHLSTYRSIGVTSNDLISHVHELVRIGRLTAGKIRLAEMQIDVFTTDIESRFFRVKTEIDLDED